MSDVIEHFGVKGMRWGVRKKEDAPVRKSGHRVRLEAKYLNSGFSVEQAQRKADSRIKVEKILAYSGAAVVGAALAYTAYTAAGKRFTGVTLKAGTDLKNINAFGDKINLDRRLYTTFKDSDTKKYRGLLANTLHNNVNLVENGSSTIYETTLKLTKDIKAPSQRKAARLFKEFQNTDVGRLLAKRDTYKKFNQNLVIEENDVNKYFYDFMRSKGYNAILDANDQFISGYNTKKPLIVFNAASTVVKTGQKVLDQEVSKKLAQRQLVGVMARTYSPAVGIGVAALAGKKAVGTSAKYQAVNDHLMKNPKDSRSPAELYNSLTINLNGKWVIK